MESTLNNQKDSVFIRYRRLYSLIKNGVVGQEVIDELLPGGEPHQYEKQLWDYKLEFPSPPIGSSKADRSRYDIKIAEILKDVVSFYNSYGGYLVIGVSNSPRAVVGFDREFDCDGLNRRVKALTRCQGSR